jgi:nucleoside-diphosphate-sugar epimerase
MRELKNSAYFWKSSNFVELPLDLTISENCLDLPEVDFVFHLAAINGTNLFYEIPWDVFFNSSASTINILERYKNSERIKRFIYTSSSEVYADLVSNDSTGTRTNESSPVGFRDVFNSRWSYGGAKLLGEIGLIAAGNQFSFPYTIVRYHNVYGPGMGLNHVMPDFIDRGKRGIFELYGSSNVRSFIYIDDAIDATILASHSSIANQKLLHVGSMDPISMLDLAKEIMCLCEWTGEIVTYPAPNGSTNYRCPDTTFLNEGLNFRAKTGLSEGLSVLLQDMNAI